MSRIPVHAVLTDGQWRHLQRWFPAPAPTGRPITRSRRTLLDAIAWQVRAGAPWRYLPAGYGPWQTAYWLFRTWQARGIWPMIVKAIRTFLDTAGHLDWTVSVDSTTVRAHRSAAGAATRPVPGEPDDHALGRSRGGWTTRSTSPPTPPRRC
jgi:transposase